MAIRTAVALMTLVSFLSYLSAISSLLFGGYANVARPLRRPRDTKRVLAGRQFYQLPYARLTLRHLRVDQQLPFRIRQLNGHVTDEQRLRETQIVAAFRDRHRFGNKLFEIHANRNIPYRVRRLRCLSAGQRRPKSAEHYEKDHPRVMPEDVRSLDQNRHFHLLCLSLPTTCRRPALRTVGTPTQT